MAEQKQAAFESVWARIANLRKNVFAIASAIGIVVGAVLGVIQLTDWLGGVGEEPIRVDYQYLSGPMDGVIPVGFDSDTNPSDYLPTTTPSEALSTLKDDVAFTDPFVWINVTSQVEDETVSLAPYLVLEVSDVTPMPETVNYAVYQPGGGAGGEIDYFVAALSPEREEVFYAPQWTADASLGSYTPVPALRKTDPFFTLTPGGETEFFQLDISMLPGYFYHFRVGVQYSYRGRQGVVWSEEFAAGMPHEADVWLQPTYGARFEKLGDLQSLEEYFDVLDNPLLKLPPRHDESEIQRAASEQERIVQNYGYPYTPPDQINY